MTMDDALHLMCWKGFDPNTRTHEQERIRDFTVEESKRLNDATGFLRNLTSRSPYQELLEARTALKVAVSTAQDAWGGKRGFPSSEVRTVQRACRDWLAAFRAFDDRTTHYLSRRFGRDKEPRRVLKQALADEFDTVFEYRVATQLRNASVHVGNVINRIGASSREDSKGTPIHGFVLAFDGPGLAERFPDMKASVRRELKELKEDLPVDRLVSEVTASCTRALARLYVSLESEIDAACSVLESCHQEALDAGGRAANVMSTPKPSDSGRLVFEFRWVEVQHAWAAREALSQCQQFLSRQASSASP